MTPVVVSSVTPLRPSPIRVQRCGSSARPARSASRMTPYSSESTSVVSGTAPSASNRVPRCTSRVASPPSSRSMFGPMRSPPSSRNSNSRWVHHQYSSSASPFQANTGTPVGCSGVPSPTTIAAAAWSWVEKMLQLTQRTSAPSAVSVSISTAVWMVMCSEPAMRAPASGWASPYSSRRLIRPGISCSAREISLRPKPARERSATLKSPSVSTRVPVLAVMSLQCPARPRVGGRSRSPSSEHAEASAGLVPCPRVTPSPRRRGRASVLDGGAGVDDQGHDLLVVHRVRLIGDLRASALQVLLPGTELVLLPARVVEELVEDDHRPGHQPRSDLLEHGDRGRVEIAVDVQEVHRTGVRGEEPGERVVEPADDQFGTFHLRQLVEGERTVSDVRAVDLRQSAEGVEAVDVLSLADLGEHPKSPPGEESELQRQAAVVVDLQPVPQRALRVGEGAGGRHHLFGPERRAAGGIPLTDGQEVSAGPELDPLDLPDSPIDLIADHPGQTRLDGGHEGPRHPPPGGSHRSSRHPVRHLSHPSSVIFCLPGRYRSPPASARV